MTNTTEFDNKIAALERELEELRRKKERYESVPDEPADGTVLSVDMKWRLYETQYTYVIVRCGDKWYVSGKIKKSFLWEDLIIWIRQSAWHGPLRVMSPSETILGHELRIDLHR